MDTTARECGLPGFEPPRRPGPADWPARAGANNIPSAYFAATRCGRIFAVTLPAPKRRVGPRRQKRHARRVRLCVHLIAEAGWAGLARNKNRRTRQLSICIEHGVPRGPPRTQEQEARAALTSDNNTARAARLQRAVKPSSRQARISCRGHSFEELGTSNGPC